MQIQIPSLELQRDMVSRCHGVDHVEHEVPVREDESVDLEPKREVKLETWELAQKWCYIHRRGCPHPRRVGRWRCGLAAFALHLTSRRFSLAYGALSKYLNLWPAFKNQDISHNSAGFWISSERPKGLATKGHLFAWQQSALWLGGGCPLQVVPASICPSANAFTGPASIKANTWVSSLFYWVRTGRRKSRF